MHLVAENSILAEPGEAARLTKTLEPDAHVSMVTVDPIGAAIPLGTDHYFQLLQSIADAIASCETSH